MGIISNNFTYGFGYNITASGPIDSRMRVEYLSDLYDIEGETSVWDKEFKGINITSYAGMVVSVLENNTVYMLMTEKNKETGKFSKCDPSKKESWKNIGIDDSLIQDFSELKSEVEYNEELTASAFVSINDDLQQLVKTVGKEGTEETNATGLYQYIDNSITNVDVKTITTEKILVPEKENVTNPILSKFLENYNGIETDDGQKYIPSGITFQEFVTTLLSDEDWGEIKKVFATISTNMDSPSVSSSTHSNGNVVKYGTVVKLNSVNAKECTYTKTNPYIGVKYGYSDINDSQFIVRETKKSGNVKVTQTDDSSYVLKRNVKGWTNTPTNNEISHSNHGDCKFNAIDLTVNFGENTYKVNQTGCTYDWEHDEIKINYLLSNLNNLKEVNVKIETSGGTTNEMTGASNEFKIIGVYPIYTNKQGDKLTENVSTEVLISGDTLTVSDVPSEVGKTPFMIDFPSTKNILKIDFLTSIGESEFDKAKYTVVESEREFNGVKYKRFITDGTGGDGLNYRFTFSSSMSVK